MGVVTCRVYCLDDTTSHDPIEGALVRVFDSTGAVFVTSGSTNPSGYFQFDVNGSSPATRYQVRCSKIGDAFTNPEYIDVYDPLPVGTTNDFNVYGNIFEVPNSIYPRMCRATGIFVDPGGRPVPDLLIKFSNLFDPVIVDNVSVSSAVSVRTDSNGYVSVELFRGGKYTATVSGLHDENLHILVPDRAGVNLMHLLYPVVQEVSFSPSPPWNIPAGTSITVTPTVILSSYAELEGVADGDVYYGAGDSSVAVVSVSSTSTITITGRVAGSTTLDLTRLDSSVKRVPDPAIVGSGSVITVT